MKGLAHLAFPLACATLLSSIPLVAERDQAQKLYALVSDLKDPQASDRAASELEKLTKSDPSLKKSLASEIKPIIAKGPKGGRPWINAVNLAGVLKLTDLAPDIAAFVDRTGMYFIGPLRDQYPAGAALVEMGDPAIPALDHVARTGSTAQRDMAPMFIRWIGTPAARHTLEALLKMETDPKRKERIENLLKGMERSP